MALNSNGRVWPFWQAQPVRILPAITVPHPSDILCTSWNPLCRGSCFPHTTCSGPWASGCPTPSPAVGFQPPIEHPTPAAHRCLPPGCASGGLVLCWEPAHCHKPHRAHRCLERCDQALAGESWSAWLPLPKCLNCVGPGFLLFAT